VCFAGADLNGFFGPPIGLPDPGLQLTFPSRVDKICLAIGANPEVADNPAQWAQYIGYGLEERVKTM
jgi:hypothetical protein